MDILAHTLWNTVGAKQLNKSLAEKRKPKISILGSAFWSIFPDLFAFSIPFFLSVYSIVFGGKSLGSLTHHTTIQAGGATFDLASYLYQYSHSLIIFLFVFLVVWLIFKRPRLAMLGWALHILIDIPSHSLQFFPTPFLFPFSNYRFPYGLHWSSPTFMIVNYSLLLIIYAYYLFRKRSQLQLKGEPQAEIVNH
jgi:hypothetical protein